jgi:hypothetical protein
MALEEVQKFGVQGGRGSFNEQALRQFLDSQGIDPESVAVEYLFTTPRVLASLESGQIQAGRSPSTAPSMAQ